MTEQERDMTVIAFIALARAGHLETKLGVMGTIVADRIQALQADNARLRAACAKLADDILQRDSEYIANGTCDDTWMSAETSVAQDIRAILDGAK